MELPPPPPPRPDLAIPGTGGSWRVANPGRMNAPAVVGAGFRLWTEQWLPWSLVTLVFVGVLSVVQAAIDPTSGTYQRGRWFDDPSAGDVMPLLLVLTLVPTLLLGPWLYVILSRASLRATIDRDRGRLIARTIRGVPSVLWIFVILLAAAVLAIVPFVAVAAATIEPGSSEPSAVLILFGLALFVLVFFWLVPRLILVIHTYVAEDRRGTTAIAESWRRTRGSWWMVLGVIVLNVLIGFAISLIPSSIAATAFPDATVAHAVPRAVILSIVNAVVTPIGVAITSVLYLELSARKGVLSQETLARNLSRFDDR